MTLEGTQPGDLVQDRRVAVVGSANVDLLVEVHRRPAAGETLLGEDLRRLPGGKGANQAAAAARSGASVVFSGCVGADPDGDFLIGQLQRVGVDTAGAARGARPTGAAVILVTPDGENSIVVSPGANAEFDIRVATSVERAWRDAAVVVLSLEIPLETVAHVAARAADSGTRVMVNAAPSTKLTADLLARCDPLIVNEHEAPDILGTDPRHDPGAGPQHDHFEGVAHQLLERGARSVVITLGEDGAVVADAHGTHRVAAHRVRVVDTTGAGDAFVGALAAELARGCSLLEAVRFAAAFSALSVQRIGAQSSYPERDEADRLLAGSD